MALSTLTQCVPYHHLSLNHYFLHYYNPPFSTVFFFFFPPFSSSLSKFLCLYLHVNYIQLSRHGAAVNLFPFKLDFQVQIMSIKTKPPLFSFLNKLWTNKWRGRLFIDPELLSCDLLLLRQLRWPTTFYHVFEWFLLLFLLSPPSRINMVWRRSYPFFSYGWDCVTKIFFNCKYIKIIHFVF